MIRITVDMLPKGDKRNAYTLAVGYIWNTGGGPNDARGNYKYTFSKRGKPTSIWKSGEVRDFPRSRFGAWYLLCIALGYALGDGLLRLKAACKRSSGSTAAGVTDPPEISGSSADGTLAAGSRSVTPGVAPAETVSDGPRSPRRGRGAETEM